MLLRKHYFILIESLSILKNLMAGLQSWKFI